MPLPSEHRVTEQAILVSQSTMNEHKKVTQFALFNEDGSPFSGGVQAAAQTDVPALTSAAASGGEPPTEAEYNALRTDVNNMRTVVNDLLAKLRTAGVIDT